MNLDSAILSAVKTQALCRHYRMGDSLIRAIDGVSLDVASGEFIALLGSSGSGKSSLLNLIAGLDQPTSGSVLIHGRDLSRMSREELADYRCRSVGMVFQAFNLIPSMTLMENVELPLRFAKTERRGRAAVVMDALERVGLIGRRSHRPGELSGGEQQRASLARALVNQPTLLLADEPTGNLDSRTGREIMDLIADCNQTLRSTVILVTHERSLVEAYAQRMVFLADGKIIDEDSSEAGPFVSRKHLQPRTTGASAPVEKI